MLLYLFNFKQHDSIERLSYLLICIHANFSIVGGVSGFFPLTILGVCLAGTSAILDQDTSDDSKAEDLKSMKNAVDAATTGMSKLDVGLTFMLIVITNNKVITLNLGLSLKVLFDNKIPSPIYNY